MLESVCAESPIKQQCDLFVDQFALEITKFLEEQLQPESLCGELALCISNKVSLFLFFSLIYFLGTTVELLYFNQTALLQNIKTYMSYTYTALMYFKK